MRAFVTVYSKIFMESQDDSWSARPNSEICRRLYSGEGSARWIALVNGYHISLGDPASASSSASASATQGDSLMYLPPWFMDTAGLLDGDEIDMEFKKSEDLQKATRLSFKVIGNIPDDLDIRDLLEEPLSQLGVIEAGQMIPIPALEGTVLLLDLSEPEGLVFLDGAEIALDIQTDAEEGEKAEGEKAPIVPPLDNPQEPFDFSEMLPSASSSLEAKASACSEAKAQGKQKFIPFQGVGRRLDS